MKRAIAMSFLLFVGCGGQTSSENAASNEQNTRLVDMGTEVQLTDELNNMDERLNQVEQLQTRIADESQRQKQELDDLHNRVVDVEENTANLPH